MLASDVVISFSVAFLSEGGGIKLRLNAVVEDIPEYT